MQQCIPHRTELKRPDAVMTGMVVCPTMVAASEILADVGKADELLAEAADDNRDFLPPVMSFEEEDEIVETQLERIVADAELSAEGKKELRRILKENRAAFGMQLRKVNFEQEPVHVPLNGVPEHQPRRVIRDVRVRDAQIMWEEAMKERGVVGEYKGNNPESLRPINIHHVIKFETPLHGGCAHSQQGDGFGLVPSAVADGGIGAFSAEPNVFVI
jgi:hypothetical protein